MEKKKVQVYKMKSYSLRIDPVQSPLSFSFDARHCLNSIEKIFPAKQTLI